MQKKILMILGVASLLFAGGCNAKKVETEDAEQIKSYIEGATAAKLEAEYSSLQNSDGFAVITKDQLLSSIGNSKVNAIIYMGYPGCENCQNAIASIQSAAIATEQTVYSLDVSEEIVTDEDYDEIYNALESILVSLDKNNPDAIELYTPHVFAIVNGELRQGYVGYTEGYDYTPIVCFSQYVDTK